MKLTDETYDEIAVVSIQGELTVDEIDAFTRKIDELTDKDVRDFVLDLESLDFVDSRGLETLLWLQESAGERLGQVRLVSPNESMMKILEITRLEHHFDAFDDVDSAVRSLR